MLVVCEFIFSLSLSLFFFLLLFQGFVHLVIEGDEYKKERKKRTERERNIKYG